MFPLYYPDHVLFSLNPTYIIGRNKTYTTGQGKPDTNLGTAKQAYYLCYNVYNSINLNIFKIFFPDYSNDKN
jgi:hypothetical protein